MPVSSCTASASRATRSSRSSTERSRSSTTPGHEIVRHGPSGFLGEVNLLSGQTVFVSAQVVPKRMRGTSPSTATRCACFSTKTARLSDLVLAAFIARREVIAARPGHRS